MFLLSSGLNGTVVPESNRFPQSAPRLLIVQAKVRSYVLIWATVNCSLSKGAVTVDIDIESRFSDKEPLSIEVFRNIHMIPATRDVGSYCL